MKIDQAVKAIIIQDDKVLILKQHVGNSVFYSLPGGRIQGEDMEAELVREVKEETGLDVVVNKYVADWSFTRANGNITQCRVYSCSPVSAIQLHSNNSEDEEDIQGFLWMSSEEIEVENLPLDKELKEIIFKFF
jgi:8-oxo-dGTP pyrophosphatase MutT (NUDIX family)